MAKQKLIETLAQAASQAQQLGKLPSVALPEVAGAFFDSSGDF